LHVLGLFAASTFAQPGPCGPWDEPVSLRRAEVQTIGGVSYLRLEHSFECGWRLAKRAVVVQGTNVNAAVSLGAEPVICPPVEPPPRFTETATIVLGALAPGDYACNIFTPSGIGPVRRIAHVPFSVVPAKTLSLRRGLSAALYVDVEGTTNATYEVQSSITLTNWKTILTQADGPFTFSVVLTNAAAFFKVRVTDRVPTCPQAIAP
jgi:hypothetical protein